MGYTEEQISMLESMENGVVWNWGVSPYLDEIVHYLMEENLCAAKENIQSNLIMLTENGRRVLQAYRTEKQIARQQEERFQRLQAQIEPLEELKRIASAAEGRAELAVKEAEGARKESFRSRIISIVALIISAAMLVFDVLEKIGII